MIYDILLFEQLKNHNLTITYRDGRYAKKRKVFRTTQIKRALRKQDTNSDIYISKYPVDMAVSTIILDFDTETGDKEDAYKDALTCHKYLKTKGMNSFIVSSTNKGYHVYIQIPPTSFKVVDKPNILFKHYVEHIIGELDYPTLDEINTSAGLHGNIRVIGSIHPSTHEIVSICIGKPIDIRDAELSVKYYKQCYNYHDVIYKNALYLYDKEIKQRQLKKEELNIQSTPTGEKDPLSYDLRELVKEIFNPSIIKEYGDSMWITCFEHDDNNPSMIVTEDYYFCKSCGARGNAWTLIKNGYWKPFKNEEITQRCKKCQKKTC